MTMIRFLVITLIFLTPFSVGNAAAGKRIVDLATHQEMILYSIATDYAMLGMRIDYHDPKADMAKQVTEYEKNNAELLKIAPTAFSPDQQKQQASTWTEIKTTVNAAVDIKAMQKLYNNTKSLEKAFEGLAEKQAEQDHNAKEETYVLVGELGMEGQRLSALYMMKTWGAGDAAVIAKETQEAFKEVQVVFGKLEKLQDSDAKAKAMIEKVEKDILLIEHLIDSDKSFPVLIEKSAEKLMDEVEELLTYVSAFISWLYASFASV